MNTIGDELPEATLMETGELGEACRGGHGN
jgi:hypothetical protein